MIGGEFYSYIASTILYSKENEDLIFHILTIITLLYSITFWHGCSMS